MRSWWGKFSSKEERKKENKESIINTIQRKLKIGSDTKRSGRSGIHQRRCRDTISEWGAGSQLPSRSPSPSHVSRCQSFIERPHALPLPVPGLRQPGISRSDSGISTNRKQVPEGASNAVHLFPLPRPGCIPSKVDHVDADGDLATASNSSDSSSDSDDPSDLHVLSPLTSDYENGNKPVANSPSSIMKKNQYPAVSHKKSEPGNFSINKQAPATSKRPTLGHHVQNLQIPPRGIFYSAPDSSLSSPSRSPVRVLGSEQYLSPGFLTARAISDVGLLGSGHCSSPGSGHNSGHNSVGGDVLGQLFWPNSRCSPECSPIPSPRMTSPGPSSRIQSGAVTPLHPRAGATAVESPTSRPDDGRKQSHPLPLPPLMISNACPFSPGYSTVTSPSKPRSPNRMESPTSPGSRWKKGRQLGRGTFGDVYLGFNSERGEMCAMKEVTLFSDDAKSRESAQQLGQEIALLSQLRHPNIVQYYGSETIDDKLYIYLEYVSGGSIHKLLQEYGRFGKAVIRSYTQQILSGLAYLHSKNTVHRDIKGANILVDPSGRVKLADFGMAKHITGQSCPLSFKGSPHWMAPEVMMNSNGCNLAVDIWSLGCTVLEMATGKPPWSQYEGVAAMFKIGNSKELPTIPDHLCEDGKNFVRQCLQRNPSQRPTASRLLEHPFVKNVVPLDMPIFNVDPSEAMPSATNTGRSMVTGYPRNLDSEGSSIHHSRTVKSGLGYGDVNNRKNSSCPVSPVEKSIMHSRSPTHMSGRMSPSPISSPLASGSSTPVTGGSGAIPFNFSKQPTYLQENKTLISRSQSNFYTSKKSYQEPAPDLFCGRLESSRAYQEMISVDGSNALANQSGRNGREDVLHGQSVLADHVSHHLLRDQVKSKRSPNLNQNLSSPSRTNGP